MKTLNPAVLCHCAGLFLAGCVGDSWKKELSSALREGVIALADASLDKAPVTVTASFCPRSCGGLHDFYSEGDYWWPDPENPDNFSDHRLTMVAMSEKVGALTSTMT